VLVAIIGQSWLASSDSQGRRRLDNADDFVRQELAGALQQKITVIPVLLDDTPWLDSASLPDDLKPLLTRNYMAVRHETFGKDISALIAAIRIELRPAPEVVRARRIAIAYAVSATAALAVAVALPEWWLNPLRSAGAAMEQAYNDRRKNSVEARAAADRAREEQERQTAAQERLRLEEVRRDDAAFESAVRMREPAAFKVYLEQYPAGRHYDKALSQLAALEQEGRDRAEATAWERARSVGTLAEHQEYLRGWPSGRHRDEAQQYVDKLGEIARRWGSLKEVRAPERLRNLLLDARGTEYEATIEARLNEVERSDKTDWTKAEQAGARAKYATYLADWPEGDYREEARARLADIEASALEWNRIKGKSDEAALEVFLRRDHIADFESAALAELVALRRLRDKSLPKGISMLTADAMATQINGKTIRFVQDGTTISFNTGTRAPETLKLRPSYLQTTTKEKFSIEGPFVADIMLDGRRLSIGGIAGVQESRVDKTGSLLLLQILATDHSEHDFATVDRLYATLQIIRDAQGHVCIGTQWSFMHAQKPEPFSGRCQFD
jgi:hypothetical protein